MKHGDLLEKRDLGKSKHILYAYGRKSSVDACTALRAMT